MKVIIAGDFAPRARLAKQIKDKRFSEVFPENLRAIIKSADFSFVNFESPIVEDAYQPISKCGPNLRCTPEAAEAVKYAGFTGVTMANNHILDYGSDGLHKSVECCKSQGLDIVGVGDNLADAEKVLYLNKDGKCLAVINCCEHEFSIATETKAGANPLNPVYQYYSIREAKKYADYVLIIIHGGTEYLNIPSPRMQDLYRFFIDSGADIVVNHHQHCYSGYELYKGKPIFYGIGNFLFDWNGYRSCFWNMGFMLSINFEDEKIQYQLYPYIQCDKNPRIDLLNGLQQEKFHQSISEINTLISDRELLNQSFRTYCDKFIKNEYLILNPYNNRLLKKLFLLGLLPNFVKKKRNSILNHIMCESHRDVLVHSLSRDYNE